MNDLATLMGAPRSLTVDGREYHIYPLTLGDLGKLQAWLNSKLPDPFRAIEGRLEGLTVEQQKYLLRDAADRANRPRVIPFQSAEGQELLQTFEGVKELLWLSIHRGDPGFSREDAEALAGRISLGALDAIQDTAFGEPGGTPGPKAE